jgi:hypothetical protein
MTMKIRSISVLLLCVFPVCTSCSRHAPAGTAASKPATTQAASRPASSQPGTRPGSNPASSSGDAQPDLTDACRKTAAALRGKLDGTFVFAVSPPFVVAGNLTQADLDAFTRHTVVRAAKAMWASYFGKKPDKVITVLLFADEKGYRGWAKKLYGDADVAFYGYYKPDERALVMNIATGGGTLVHELTHALVVYDFPEVPRWFNEGLASLHEQCTVGEDRITGHVNWRLKGLREAIDAGKLRPLRELLTADDFYGPKQGMNYAQARYFCQYMQEKDLLRKFYAHLHDNHEGKDSSAKAVERVFGRKVEEVEKDFLAWVNALKIPR